MDLLSLEFIIFLTGGVILLSSKEFQNPWISMLVAITGWLLLAHSVSSYIDTGKLELAQKIICDKNDMNSVNTICKKNGWRLIRNDNKPIKIIYPKDKNK